MCWSSTCNYWNWHGLDVKLRELLLTVVALKHFFFKKVLFWLKTNQQIHPNNQIVLFNHDWEKAPGIHVNPARLWRWDSHGDVIVSYRVAFCTLNLNSNIPFSFLFFKKGKVKIKIKIKLHAQSQSPCDMKLQGRDPRDLICARLQAPCATSVIYYYLILMLIKPIKAVYSLTWTLDGFRSAGSAMWTPLKHASPSRATSFLPSSSSIENMCVLGQACYKSYYREEFSILHVNAH